MIFKWILLILSTILGTTVLAELKIEHVSTNQVNSSRDGQLLLVRGQTGTNSWSEYVYFKGKPILLRGLSPKLTLQLFFKDAPVNVAVYDSDSDGRLDRIELCEMVGQSKTIHDLLHIEPDDRLKPYSDEELHAEQEVNEKLKQIMFEKAKHSENKSKNEKNRPTK